MSKQFELRHIRGIPYYLSGNDVYTFELDSGKPGANCIAIGSYHAESDSIQFFPDWRNRVQSNLDAFRASLISIERDKLRQNIIKPQKSRKTTRTSRKDTTKTKNPKSK